MHTVHPYDIILDAFCGCGTALVAAQNLSRQWIGIDISPTACRVMAKRLRDVCNMKESEPLWKAHRDNAFIVRDLPWTEAKLRALPPFEFENWAVIALGGIPNKVQVGDMGVDGRIFPVFDNSPAIYGWVHGSESSQVPSGTKGPCRRPPCCRPSLTGL